MGDGSDANPNYMLATYPKDTEPTGRLTVPAGQLEQAMGWMETSKDVPAPIAITVQTIIWLLQVDAFRRQEADAIIDEKYNSSLDEHRYVLSQITTNGEKLFLAAKQNGITKFLTNDFTIDDVKSTLESLRLTSQLQYGQGNSKRINQGVEKLFDVA